MMRSVARTEVMGLLLGDDLVDLSVRIWEPASSTKSVVCVHGFSGTGQDFEILAETLSKAGVTVIAPDLIGRGASSFLGDEFGYSLRNFMACIAAAAKFAKPDNCHLGSSWGAIILMAYLASKGWPSRGVVLNDIPIKSDANLQGFRDRLKSEVFMSFSSRQEAGDHIISSRSMEFLTAPQREKLFDSRIMQVGDQWRLRMDPAVAGPFGNAVDYSMMAMLRAIPVPTLMAYGNKSPFANYPELTELAQVNPNIRILNDLDDPHPPSLMKDSQVLLIAGYLAQCFGRSPILA